MTKGTKTNPHHGSSVNDWFAEEEARHPGFLAEIDEEVERMALAHKLRELREAAGLSQAQLAKRVGTKAPGIARLESGRFAPRIGVLRKVASALGARLRIDFDASKNPSPARKRAA
jgi:ribosome-binding protein aMBF1 (putative translation factor)